MRKTAFVNALFSFAALLCLAVLTAAPLPAFTQDSPSAAAPVSTQAANPATDSPPAAMPTDPKALMLLAAKSNGLIGDDMKPWHLKVSYKLLDEKGNVTDQGIFEEYWVSQTKYKLTFTSKTGSRTEYGTDKGVLNSDSEKPVDTHDMRRHLLSPVPSVHSVENSDFSLRQDTVDGEKLNCLNLKRANGNPSGFTYCLDTQKPALRTTDAGGTERILRNNIISFQGHYIAEDMQIQYASFGSIPAQSLTAHVDSIDALNTIDEAIFTPPSNAIPQKIEVRKINITSGVAQEATKAATPPAAPAEVTPAGVMPSDPKELMQLAAKTNGLTGDDMKPWHLKFSFTLFDQDGKKTNSGIYEEYWASWNQYKIIKTDAKFTEIDYGTEHGFLQTGEKTEIPEVFSETSQEFIAPFGYYFKLPFAQPAVPQTTQIEEQKQQIGKAKLRCIRSKNPAMSDKSIDTYGPLMCIEQDIPALRISTLSATGREYLFNTIVAFRGRYVVNDLIGTRDGKPEIHAHLDTLESFDAQDEALFAPPPGTKLNTITAPILPSTAPQVQVASIPKKVTISGSISQGLLIKADPPFYPIWAEERRVSGTVVVRATIGKDGHIHGAHAIYGPDELRDAAVDAVKRWVYKPYMLNGNPVEVETTVNVVFRLNH